MNLHIALFKYLEGNLRASIALAEAARDTEWLLQQNPKAIALLYGSMADRVFRVMELWGTLAHPFLEAHCEEALQARRL